MKAIVVGAGGTTRELLNRLGTVWDVTVVESSEEKLSSAAGMDGIHTLHGDGTSRLVLEKAGLSDAEAVVAATADDEANLEVCRIARQAGVLHIAAVAACSGKLKEYREMGVAAFSPDSLVARRIELSLEHRRMSSMAFADGRAEAIEFQIGPDSPVCDKALHELRGSPWIVGAILRGEQVIIPHGDSVLRAGDRVTVVGDGAHFAEIVRTFTSSEARFPLGFGKRVAAVLEHEDDLAGPIAEAANLVRNSAATSLLLVYRDPASFRDEEMASGISGLLERAQAVTADVEVYRRAVPMSPMRALPGLCLSESVGILVAREGAGYLSYFRTRKAVLLTHRARVPVLIARGSFPYKAILAPARQTPAGEAAGRAAIDLALYAKAELTGVAVVDPIFVDSPRSPWKVREDIGWLRHEAALHEVRVHGQIKRGNPVRALLEVGTKADLIVLGIREGPGHWLKVSVAAHVAARFRKSILLVPVRE